MTEAVDLLRSRLSALMDGEVDDFELRRAIDVIGEDAELRDKWRRYHVAASALRSEPGQWQVDLSAQISAAVAAEPVPRRRLLTGALGRAAVAASVAALTIAGARYWLPGDSAEQPIASRAGQTGLESPYRPVAQRAIGSQMPAVRAVAATGQAPPVPLQHQEIVAPLSAAQELRVWRYVDERMLDHADATSSHQGLLPVVRVPRAEER